MKYKSTLLILTTIACSSQHSHVRYVPAEEAAWFKFPSDLPSDGEQNIPGAFAVAIQLAMDDFLPRGSVSSWGKTPQQVCLNQRQSYDVEAAPGPEAVIWVNIALSPGACTRGPGPLLDVGATYAVDTRGWRILAVREP